MKTISTHYESARNKFSRISWGGVLAGALAAITISFLLNLLGMGIGLNSIDPMTDSQPFAGLGIGTIIWWVLSNLAALFVGGLIAARAAGLPSATDGGLHGFLAWGVYLVISVLFITSLTGSIFSGMGSLVSSVFDTDNSNEVLVNLKNAQMTSQDETSATFEGIKKEMYDVLETAQNYNIIPADSKQEVKEGLNQAENSTSKAIKQLNLKDAITSFVNDISVDLDNNGDLNISVKGDKDYINKEDFKAYLVENTDLTEEEINGVVEKWNKKIDTAIVKIENTYKEAKEKALAASEKISDALGEASIYLFFMLLLGALAAFFGGATGAPLLNVTEEHDQDLAEERIY